MITTIRLCSPAECERLVAEVHALRECWVRRGPDPCAFFSLGAASYCDDEVDYRRIASVCNPVLMENFGDLLDSVCSALARPLDAPVRLADDLALPGFHIFSAPALSTTSRASIHFDLQYERFEPADAVRDFDQYISFTLPLRLPRCGSGLNLWPFTYQKVCAFHKETRSPLTIDDLAALTDPVYVPYLPGVLVLHSGHQLHQIAPASRVDPDDERITLQGHGIWRSGGWHLYW
jgi:hypothetical protein